MNLIINGISAFDREKINLLIKNSKSAAQVVTTTVKPDAFFDNLNYLLDCLLTLKYYEKYNIFEQPTPSQYYESIISGLEETVDDFINRALENNKAERSKLKNAEKTYESYESFLISLISAFDCSNTFWKGDGRSPHYTGALFTENNYQKVQMLYDGLDQIYDCLISNFVKKKIDKKHKNVGNIHKGVLKKEEPLKLSYIEKERIMVERISSKDMRQFSNIPYNLGGTIHKFMEERGHPFAYINLRLPNIMIARKHLSYMNKLIESYRKEIPLLTNEFYINVNKIVFHEYDPNYGYSRLICEPYTFTGKIAKFPLTLSFMSRLNIRSYQANGSIYYGEDGNIKKADIHIYSGGIGWSFYFATVENELVLEKATTTLKPQKNGLPSIVYKREG